MGCAIIAPNCILLLRKMPKISSCIMTMGNYSSDLVPPGGGDGNYLNIQEKCYENDSKQSGIVAF